jgi:hypothetical protein
VRQAQVRSRGNGRAGVGAVLFFAWAAIATSASADVVTVTAQGTIQSSCGISIQSAFGAANLNANGSVSASALVECNTPYRIRTSSANGALKSATTAPAQFSNSLDYSLSFAVPLDAGGQISATCGSVTLISGASSCALSPASANGLSSGGGTSTSKTATLALQWTLPTSTRLIAGNYADVLTVTIAAQQ